MPNVARAYQTYFSGTPMQDAVNLWRSKAQAILYGRIKRYVMLVSKYQLMCQSPIHRYGSISWFATVSLWKSVMLLMHEMRKRRRIRRLPSAGRNANLLPLKSSVTEAKNLNQKGTNHRLGGLVSVHSRLFFSSFLLNFVRYVMYFLCIFISRRCCYIIPLLMVKYERFRVDERNLLLAVII
jgi:hypothetical protein